MYTIRKLVFKVIRSPITITDLVFDRFFVPFWLKSIGVRFGHSCQFEGMPFVSLDPESFIELGDNVHINSKPKNPLGIVQPTMLTVLAPASCIRVGSNTGISSASIVAQGAVTIGERVLIGAGACIWDTDFHPLNADQRRIHMTRGAKSAPIVINDEVFVGSRAIILKGVHVGRRAVIGAGSVVTKDIEPGSIVAGNPARVVGNVDNRVDEK